MKKPKEKAKPKPRRKSKKKNIASLVLAGQEVEEARKQLAEAVLEVSEEPLSPTVRAPAPPSPMSPHSRIAGSEDNDSKDDKGEGESEFQTGERRHVVETGFRLFVRLMQATSLRRVFDHRDDLLHQLILGLDVTVHEILPVLHTHLETEGLYATMYAVEWFTAFRVLCAVRYNDSYHGPLPAGRGIEFHRKLGVALLMYFETEHGQIFRHASFLAQHELEPDCPRIPAHCATLQRTRRSAREERQVQYRSKTWARCPGTVPPQA